MGAWRVMDILVKAREEDDEYEQEDVICMQEIAMTKEEAEAFKRVANRNGYRGHYVGGYWGNHRHGGKQKHGGVMTLVMKEFRTEWGHTASSGTAAVVTAKVDD